MRATVIGAAGYLGRVLVRELVEREWEVEAWCRTSHPDLDRLSPKVVTRHIDVLGKLPPISKNTSAVFYLAQYAPYRDFPAGADQLFGVNVNGAIKAAHEARVAGAGSFIYASTGTVYQPSFSPLTERSPLMRTAPYPLSKLIAEEALALFQPYMKVSCVRIFGLFGPDQQAMLASRLAGQIRESKPIFLEPRDGHPQDQDGLRLSFCFVGDAARMLAAQAGTLAQGGNARFIMNLGGPEGVSIRRFAEGIGRSLGMIPVFERAEKPRPGDFVIDRSCLEHWGAPQFTPLDQALAASFSL